MRRTVTLLVVGALAAIATGAAGAQGKPGNGCGVGFDLGELTYDQAMALPRTQQALADGLATAEQLRAGIAAVDANGDGLVCIQLPHGFEVSSRPFGEYLYNAVDNNASVPA